ncbi:hypothetical protein [Sphingomonas sp. GC_Shp_1]|uniref:hypothetical protein n=1 Tax=Sphingomonas sp. GC_Shp_1 TaxID=2937385 RepID=UPI00226B280B|nr:hypothetical protein [Sphingomonas sp. GC_Shp_1]
MYAGIFHDKRQQRQLLNCTVGRLQGTERLRDPTATLPKCFANDLAAACEIADTDTSAGGGRPLYQAELD